MKEGDVVELSSLSCGDVFKFADEPDGDHLWAVENFTTVQGTPMYSYINDGFEVHWEEGEREVEYLGTGCLCRD